MRQAAPARPPACGRILAATAGTGPGDRRHSSLRRQPAGAGPGRASWRSPRASPCSRSRPAAMRCRRRDPARARRARPRHGPAARARSCSACARRPRSVALPAARRHVARTPCRARGPGSAGRRRARPPLRRGPGPGPGPGHPALPGCRRAGRGSRNSSPSPTRCCRASSSRPRRRSRRSSLCSPERNVGMGAAIPACLSFRTAPHPASEDQPTGDAKWPVPSATERSTW